MAEPQARIRRPAGPEEAIPLGLDTQTLDVLLGLQRDYGDIVSVPKPAGGLAYFINDPAEIRRLLVRRHAHYVKGPGFERVKMLLGNGLIVSDGDTWRRSRTMIQPAFKIQNLHRLIGVMMDCCNRRARVWAAKAAEGELINISNETSEFSLELILISIFGSDYENRLLADGENPFAFLSEDATRDLSVVLKVRQLRDTLLELIAERRGRSEAEFDFLSMYMQATDKNGVAFKDSELLDELMSLIVAGFETSANTLNWAWYLISGHPGVEARLVEEAQRCVADVSAVNADNITAMSYTQQVLEETLRLYPPVWLFTRRARTDDELVDYEVPAGTDIYLSPYVLHRSEHLWPNPEKFDPDRFDVSSAADSKVKQGRPYFPFSLGPRRCLGEYFSFLEMKIHLGLLLQQFSLKRVNDEDPGLELAINLRSKRDIWLRPTLR